MKIGDKVGIKEGIIPPSNQGALATIIQIWEDHSIYGIKLDKSRGIWLYSFSEVEAT